MAGVKISALPPVGSSLLTDLFAAVQAGTTKRATLNQVMTLFESNITITDSNISGVITGTHGGTGVDNGNNLITIGGNITTDNSVTFVGDFPVTFTFSGTTNLTFPTTGTLATTADIPSLPISVTNGGTGLTSITNHALMLGQGVSNVATLLLTAGQLPIGTTSGDPVGASIGSGIGINVSNGSGSISIALQTPVSLSNGGTNASLTPSNGGIFYSTSSAAAILSGTSTAGQILRSGANSAPSWSTATYPSLAITTGSILRANGTNWNATTATYPDTTTANQILYSSASNTISEITTAANGVLITSGVSVPSISSTLPAAVQGNITSLGTITSGVWNGTTIAVANGGTSATSLTAHGILLGQGTSAVTSLVLSAGRIPIGTTAGDPSNALLTAGSGISITPASGSITISTTGASPWVDQTTSSVTMAVNTGYTTDAGASLVTYTLPATSAIGDWVEINGKSAGMWTIAQTAGQIIRFLSKSTTTGVTGSLSAITQFDCIRLRCVTANTAWVVVAGSGTFTLV